MYEPLDAQIGELAKTQIKIKKLDRYLSEKSGRKRMLKLKELKELKAKRTFLIERIKVGKKALRNEKHLESKHG